MTGTPKITAAEALEWEEMLGRHRPKHVTEADMPGAHTVVSYNFGVSSHGIFLRIRTDRGAGDFFLNAAVATQLVNTIRDAGAAATWMNDDDGSLIVRDPENLRHPGQKS